MRYTTGIGGVRLGDIPRKRWTPGLVRVMADRGCWVARRCVECPLPRCYEEMTEQERTAERMAREPAQELTARRAR